MELKYHKKVKKTLIFEKNITVTQKTLEFARETSAETGEFLILWRNVI
jgi:hypothetical protein